MANNETHDKGEICADDGRHEIFVGPERRGDNWLQTSPEPTLIAVRQFFLDRDNEVPISVRIVVAASDPGFGNWMSTDGHRFGAIGLRWNQAVEDVEPDVQVITIQP